MDTKHNTKDNVWRRLLNARCYLQQQRLTKEGVNSHQQFTFFRLEEIVPAINETSQLFGIVVTMTTVTNEFGTHAKATVINVDDPTETIEFSTPFGIPVAVKSASGNEVNNLTQRIGSAETYTRRYLYLKVFDIVESDSIDLTSGEAPKDTIVRKPPTAEEKEEITKKVVNKKGKAPAVMLHNLKQKLTELKTLDSSQNDYIKNILTKTNKLTECTRVQAEDLILEVDEKIKSAKETVEND